MESLQFDLEIKTRLYAKAGVEEFWVVDLPRRTLHRFTKPGPEGYKEHIVLAENEQLTPEEMANKTLCVRDLLPL